MRKFFLSLIAIAVSIYLAFAGYLYANQRSFIYFPQPLAGPVSESEYSLNNQGLSLNGWILNEGQKTAILYFGGNAEAVENNISEFKQPFRHQSVYLLSYRGFGQSEGAPSEAGLYSDALAFYDDVKKNHDSIIVIGRSLGSGVASYLASVRAVDKLILITPFDSIENVAQNVYPLFPISILLEDKYDSADRAKNISSETLLLIAEQDEIIPRAHSDRLAENFNPAKLTIKVLDGATHNTISHHQAYYPSLSEFVN